MKHCNCELEKCNSDKSENFKLTFDKVIDFRQLIENSSSWGIIYDSEFTQKKIFENMTISSDAQKMINAKNAGGNSEISEVLSFEFFNEAVQATLLKTEMEVEYSKVGGPMTDYVCEISKKKFGVSVTRAMAHKKKFTEKNAKELLTKKLDGIIKSTANSEEKWSKQILHIWTSNQQTTNDIVTVYNTLQNIRSNTVVIVTRTDDSSCIFKVKRNQNSRNRKSRHSSSKGCNPKSVHIIKPTE